MKDARARSFRVRLFWSEGRSVSRSSAIGTEDEKDVTETLKQDADGTRLDSPSICALLRSGWLLACLLDHLESA